MEGEILQNVSKSRVFSYQKSYTNASQIRNCFLSEIVHKREKWHLKIPIFTTPKSTHFSAKNPTKNLNNFSQQTAIRPIFQITECRKEAFLFAFKYRSENCKYRCMQAGQNRGVFGGQNGGFWRAKSRRFRGCWWADFVTFAPPSGNKNRFSEGAGGGAFQKRQQKFPENITIICPIYECSNTPETRVFIGLKAF